MIPAEGRKSGGQAVQVTISVRLKGLQDGQGVGQKDDVVGGLGAGLHVGCCGFQGFRLGFVVRRVEAGSKADPLFSAFWVLNVDSSPSFSNCLLSRAISIDMSP